MRTVPCPTCGGDSYVGPMYTAQDADGMPIEGRDPCPDCHEGRVPSPEAVRAIMGMRTDSRLHATSALLAAMRAKP